MPVTINGSTGITSSNGSTFTDSSGNATVNGTLTATNINPTSFKNRIINGGMQFNQRYVNNVFTNVAANEYALDRWSTYGSSASKFTVQRSTTAPTGFTYSMLVTSSAATSPAPTDIYLTRQFIEGNNVADLGWGSASAKTVTVSFWARSSVAGTYSVIIKNVPESRSYGFTYTINSANTFEYKTATIPGDTSGGWSTDNSAGLQILFSLGVGASGGLISAGSWVGTNAWGVTGQTNFVATSGATLYISGVQFEAGTVATSFDFRSYGTELALCQRYCYAQNKLVTNNYYAFGTAVATSTTTGQLGTPFPVSMRSNPSVTYSAANLFYVDAAVSSSLAFTSISADQVGNNFGYSNFGGGSVGVTGGGGRWLANNAAAAWIIWSAEL